MKRYWSKVCDEWVYELEDNDIECDENDRDDINLALVISSPDHEASPKKTAKKHAKR